MLVPLANRVVVKPIESIQTTPGGIIIPDTAKEKPNQGEVLAAGIGLLDSQGVRHPMQVKPGDKILFTQRAGHRVEIDKEELVILGEIDILAVVK